MKGKLVRGEGALGKGGGRGGTAGAEAAFFGGGFVLHGTPVG